MSPRIASQLRNSARVEHSRWHAYYQQKKLCADGEATIDTVREAEVLWHCSAIELADARARAIDEAMKIPY